MCGNVWQWCKDWYGDYNATQSYPNEKTISDSLRVLRGGSLGNSDTFSRVTTRGYANPNYRYTYCGFRVVLSQ